MSIIYRPSGRAAEYAHLAINHYAGCSHGCKYCYVPACTHNSRFFEYQSVRKDVLYRIRQQAPKFAGTDERVLLCFSTDPYQPLDRKKHITREVIKILREFDIPFQVLTKGGMRAARDFDLYGTCDAFATTLTLLDNYQSRVWEPMTALPADRIAAIETAKRAGIETWVSLEPVIDPEMSLQIIKETHHAVDHYKVGVMNHQNYITDWRAFGIAAIELLEKYNKSYHIKADLAKHLKGVAFNSIDTRKIKRTTAPAATCRAKCSSRLAADSG